MKKKSDYFYSMESIKKVVEELGYDMHDLEDIEIIDREEQTDECIGTCISCQSGCQANS